MQIETIRRKTGVVQITENNIYEEMNGDVIGVLILYITKDLISRTGVKCYEDITV